VTGIVLMGDPRIAAIPMNECGDELVDTRQLVGLESTPDENPQNSTYAFLRLSVAQRLLQAQETLPRGFRLLIAEGYRPYEQQDFYFNRRERRLMDADPTLSKEAASLRTSEFVSPPQIAPHVSGAAVDLTIIDEDGHALDMGTAIDATPEQSNQACYFAADNISAKARLNRTILATALSSAGLINYPTEWWHWSYGDRYWAFITRQPQAVFGPIHTGSDGQARPKP